MDLHCSQKRVYSKTCVKQPLSKRPKIGFQDQLSLNEGQKYCRMLQGEHSAILSTFIKLTFVVETFVLSSFEWPLYAGLTVFSGFSFTLFRPFTTFVVCFLVCLCSYVA